MKPKVLVLGGTGFIGQHVVKQCLQRGFDVSVFSRGLQDCQLPNSVKQLRGDRDSDLKMLDGSEAQWDACVDLSGYTLSHVNQSTAVLRDSVKHYVYVSAVRVFEPSLASPITEGSQKKLALASDPHEINNETYGRLKVACEHVVQNCFKHCSTIVRPQVVVGEGDLSGRLAYWVLKSRREQRALLPGDGTDTIQFIDVRDVAGFIVKAIQNRVFGEFNLAGHRLTWSEFCEKLAFKQPIWVDVAETLDFRELPLYRKNGTAAAAYMNVCNQKAIANGLVVSDVASTIAAFTHWLDKCGVEHVLLPDIAAEHLSLQKELAIINQSKIKPG